MDGGGIITPSETTRLDAMTPLTLDLLQRLLSLQPAVHRLLVGYSGGVDSHVLLHLLAARRTSLSKYSLTAVYVDHGLQTASADWGRHCAQVCRDLAIDFRALTAAARPAPGESPEAAARRARYQTLAGLVGPEDALLTAHQRDDQAETLLLQAVRGAGPHGLAAMPTVAAFGRGLLLRPLLEFDRAAIVAYARAQGLRWVEDPSNANRALDRNYLRHEALPLLRARWPAATTALARSARLCADAAALLDERADEDLAAAATERPDSLLLAPLRALSDRRLRNALRRWFRRLHLPTPAALHLERVTREALAAGRDRQPRLRWPGAELRRYRDRLYALAPLPPHDAAQILPVQPGTELVVPAIGRLGLQPAQGQGARLTDLTGRRLTIRFRQGGERFRPLGRQHSQELKKLLQEAGVPPWERDRLPLLYGDDRLLAVADLWVSAEHAAAPAEVGLILAWQKAAPFAKV